MQHSEEFDMVSAPQVDDDVVFRADDLIIRVTDDAAILDFTAVGASDLTYKRQK